MYRILILLFLVSTICHCTVISPGSHILVRIDSGIEVLNCEISVSVSDARLPYLQNSLAITGLTVEQACEHIRAAYVNSEIYRNPAVMIEFCQPVMLDLYGKVVNPGRYRIYTWQQLCSLIRKESLHTKPQIEIVSLKGKIRKLSLADINEKQGGLPGVSGVRIQ